jgi:pantoate--beta-alanine ligase
MPPRTQLITSMSEMQAQAWTWRAAGKLIGLVPTMGALHEGHLSLVEAAKCANDITVATIFVNPTQFGPSEDFAKYPRTLEQDLDLLSQAGCDFAFSPTAEEMYPPECTTAIEPPRVAQSWEGAFRPGHFRGVCTVVLKLFSLVPGQRAYFGQKDYQQQLVLRHMVRDLNVPVEIITCPIVREASGLALSSRNRYLSSTEREQALGLSVALHRVEQALRAGELSGEKLRGMLRAILAEHGIQRVDYATVAHADTLEELEIVIAPAVALIACHVGTTRLIDNQLLLTSAR